MTMKRIRNKIKYWSQLLLIPIYALTYIMPRSKNIWVFGSTFGRRFADNPKYFYLYVIQNQSSNVRAIWISKDKNIVEFLRDKKVEAYYLYSIKGIWFALRAKVYIYDNYSKDICFTLSGGAKKINLWHGIPLKMIAKDNVFDRVRNPRNFREKISSIPRRISDEKPNDYLIATSTFMKPIIQSAFQTKNVLINGYPRNDNLLFEHIKVISWESEMNLHKQIMKWKENNKIVLYMPTFRSSEDKFFDIINPDSFQEYLQNNNIIFLVKLHPKSKLYTNFKKLGVSNMIIINPENDIYNILNMVDVLVTDYSSIYFDFLITDKPIIFFSYDLEEYLNNSRKMYFDYYEFTPGPIVVNQNELEAVILEDDKYYDERNKLKQKVFDYNIKFASENLFLKIYQIINNK